MYKLQRLCHQLWQQHQHVNCMTILVRRLAGCSNGGNPLCVQVSTEFLIRHWQHCFTNCDTHSASISVRWIPAGNYPLTFPKLYIIICIFPALFQIVFILLMHCLAVLLYLLLLLFYCYTQPLQILTFLCMTEHIKKIFASSVSVQKSTNTICLCLRRANTPNMSAYLWWLMDYPSLSLPLPCIQYCQRTCRR